MFARRSLSCNRALDKHVILFTILVITMIPIAIEYKYYCLNYDINVILKAKGGWAPQHLDGLGSLLPGVVRRSLALGDDYGALQRR